MYATYTADGQSARLVTMEYFEPGELIKLSSGIYRVVNRGIYLRKWSYYIRKANFWERMIFRLGRPFR